MRPTLYSLHGLATELQRDSRQLAKALAHTPPEGTTGPRQTPAWRLATALRAISTYEQRIGNANGGNGSTPSSGRAIDSACLDAVERAAAALHDALDKLAAEPSIKRRRTQAKRVGPALISLQEALNRSGEMLPPGLRVLTEPARAELLGLALAEVGSVLDFNFDRID